MKLYMFRTVRLSIIRKLFTVHSAMVLQNIFVKLLHLVGVITKNFLLRYVTFLYGLFRRFIQSKNNTNDDYTAQRFIVECIQQICKTAGFQT